MLFDRSNTVRATIVVLFAGGALAAPTLLVGPAQAADPACTSTSTCDVTGTLTLQGGSLTATPPTALAWSTTLDGTDLAIVDGTHKSMTVSDARGTGDGWHVTASRTAFVDDGDDTNAITLTLNGSSGLDSATTAPTASCAAGSTCTNAENSETYPVEVTTSTSPAATLFDAAENSGIGKISLTNMNWWLHVPATTIPSTYTSTITFSVVSAP